MTDYVMKNISKNSKTLEAFVDECLTSKANGQNTANLCVNTMCHNCIHGNICMYKNDLIDIHMIMNRILQCVEIDAVGKLDLQCMHYYTKNFETPIFRKNDVSTVLFSNSNTLTDQSNIVYDNMVEDVSDDSTKQVERTISTKRLSP